jgi:type I restriction enzyme S subunit
MKIQKALHRVRVKNTHDAEFVFYRFLLAGKTGELEKHFIGSTIKHLTGLGLKEVEFAYPPKPVQKKIASVLSALDAKIELNNQINAELEAMAKLLYDYWFVQFDFPMTAAQAASLGRPALVGKPYKSSGGKMVHNKDLNQEIPKAWTVDVLQNLSSLIRRGVSPKYVEQGGISVLNQKCIRDQSIQFTEARRHGIELEESHDRLLQHLDVVVNSTGVGTLGRVAFVKRLNESKTTVDSHVTIVRANQKLVSPAYFVWSMLRLQPVIESAAVGSTGQVELSKTYLEQLNLVVPDGDTQSQFTEFATPVIQAIACREKQNQELTQLRDWLLPMLMNGQVTVGT